MGHWFRSVNRLFDHGLRLAFSALVVGRMRSSSVLCCVSPVGVELVVRSDGDLAVREGEDFIREFLYNFEECIWVNAALAQEWIENELGLVQLGFALVTKELAVDCLKAGDWMGHDGLRPCFGDIYFTDFFNTFECNFVNGVNYCDHGIIHLAYFIPGHFRNVFYIWAI